METIVGGEAGKDRAREEEEEEDIEKGVGVVTMNDDSDESRYFSDLEDRSWHSPYDCVGSSLDDFQVSCVSDSEIDGDGGLMSDSSSTVEVVVVKADDIVDKVCRICHLSLQGTPESGIPIELGCSCKHDLAASHNQCAETWFKIRGNKICEICGSTAKNVVCVPETDIFEEPNTTNNIDGTVSANTNTATVQNSETRNFWHGHRFLNALLACMVFAFVISWLFHFNVPG
ncbi:hypothetical protein ZOSMA_99G00340 [Zostera marina]|uniref:RING-CH-type domain-containing protein n=1 Tax=Zostera marina TaxID=29655 RepID=A0A0K9NH95_ZOSMR|nr:hypothetical protein ZOSMA_99G00340 [Zostera marina]